MVAVLTALALALIFHIAAFVVLLVWLFKKRWMHLLIAAAVGVIGGVAGFLFSWSDTWFFVIKGKLINFSLELSLDAVCSIIGAALGLFLVISSITLSSRRRIPDD